MAGLAATFPLISEGHLARAAQQAVAPKASDDFPSPASPNAIMINANENPLGPCDAALAAITSIARTGGRYDSTGVEAELTAQLAAEFGLPANHIAIYAGSSEPLQFATLALTSPTRSYVTADPSYEAGMVAAKATGAQVIKVPLTPSYAHDVRAMIAADPNAGVIYICSPNNPTGTLTPKDDILWALEHKPAGSILLVDEAYIHISGSPSVIDQVALGKDIIVLRTFSKVYGMAGIRCGAAFGRPDLLAKLSFYGRNALHRHPHLHLRVARQQGLQIHPLPLQLLHDRHRPPRSPGHGRHASARRLHRPHLASLANLRSHHCRHTPRNASLPDRLRKSHDHPSLGLNFRFLWHKNKTALSSSQPDRWQRSFLEH